MKQNSVRNQLCMWLLKNVQSANEPLLHVSEWLCVGERGQIRGNSLTVNGDGSIQGDSKTSH